MDNAPVTIIVKAPNQTLEDQTIKCEMSWNIKRLKGFLTEVYPGKPTAEEQKLIYSGQIISDTVILKDILRQYEGQDTHTVHLVITPKNRVLETDSRSKTSPVSSSSPVNAANIANNLYTDGLRQRTAAQSSVPQQQQQQQPLFSGMPGTPFVGPSLTPEEIMAQQLAMQTMMQQIYAQYMNQFMQSAQPGNQYISPQTYASQFQSMPYLPQHFAAATNNPPMAAAQPPQAVPQNDGAGHIVAPQPPQNGDVADGAVQQRFPNIVQEEVENRDWLDMFYAFSRLMVLVTLVYFYSSPFRCLIVIFFMAMYFLYHIGFFRQMMRDGILNDHHNNHQVRPNANDAMPPVAGDNAAEPAVEAVAQPPAEDADVVAENTDEPLLANAAESVAEMTANQPERTPMVALVRTFVLSFFASLIPETPAL